VRQTTADNYVVVAKYLMGWYVHVKLDGWDGVTPATVGKCVGGEKEAATATSSLEGLSLRDAIPNATAEGAGLAIEYLQWLCDVRGIAPKTEDFQLRSLIAIAKWLYGRGEAVVDGGGGSTNGMHSSRLAPIPTPLSPHMTLPHLHAQ